MAQLFKSMPQLKSMTPPAGHPSVNLSQLVFGIPFSKADMAWKN